MEFGVEIGEYRGDGPGPAAGAPTATAGAAEPERCVVAYYLQQIGFECIAACNPGTVS